jgi:hypothetical protein
MPTILLCIDFFGIYIFLSDFGYSHFGPVGLNHSFPSGVNFPFCGFDLLVLLCSGLDIF